MSSTPSVDLYNRVSDIIDKCSEDLVNLVHSVPAVRVDPPRSARSSDTTSRSTRSIGSTTESIRSKRVPPSRSSRSISFEAPPPPPAAPPLSNKSRDSSATSWSSTSTAPSSSTLCSSMTAVLKKFNGKLTDGRLYRSLDKKHVILTQLVSLEEPIGDEEAQEFERELPSISECSLTDSA